MHTLQKGAGTHSQDTQVRKSWRGSLTVPVITGQSYTPPLPFPCTASILRRVRQINPVAVQYVLFGLRELNERC